MLRYFVHLMEDVEKVIDDEGVPLPEDALIGAALRAARDWLAGDTALQLSCGVRRGSADFNSIFEDERVNQFARFITNIIPMVQTQIVLEP